MVQVGSVLEEQPMGIFFGRGTLFLLSRLFFPQQSMPQKELENHDYGGR